MKTILWFEPELVTRGSWLYEHHPEWLLTAREDPGDQAYDKEWRLLNLGNPDALKWLTDQVDTLIREQGIDLKADLKAQVLPVRLPILAYG